MSVDWGSVPDWLAAIGTVGALGTAIWVLKREGDDRRVRELFDRSKQARAIHVSPVSRSGSGSPGQSWDVECEVTVENRSDDAIHDLVMHLVVDDPLPSGLKLDPIHYAPKNLPVLVAGQASTIRRRYFVPWPLGAGAGAPPLVITPSVEFTDIAGQRWLRDTSYRLHTVPSVTKFLATRDDEDDD